jgi:hypothetical protein
MSERDDVSAEMPEDEGLVEPELAINEIEGARLLANAARTRLHDDGFNDTQIDAWARTFYTAVLGGIDEGDVDGLVAFIRAEEASGRGPSL